MQCQKLKTYMQTGRVIFVPAASVTPNPAQPRKVFSPEKLEELADSIRCHGILQPLSVRRVEGGYQLIAGERRLRAAQLAGLTDVPCIVMTMTDKESGMAALLENLQREDLDYIEQARGICTLMEQWCMSQEQVAAAIGKSQSAVSNKLRLLRHSDPVLDALRAGNLTERHARALLQLPTERDKLQVIAAAVRQEMSVSRLEQYIRSFLEGKAPEKPDVSAFLKNVSKTLAKIQQSGIPAISERKETESQIVLTLTIPKQV